MCDTCKKQNYIKETVSRKTKKNTRIFTQEKLRLDDILASYNDFLYAYNKILWLKTSFCINSEND